MVASERKYRDRRFKGSTTDYEKRLANSSTLYVGNLSFYTTEDQVYALFSRAGDVRRVVMGIDRVKKTSCGFCFVEFYCRDEAAIALRCLNGSRMDERLIRIDWDAGFEEGRQYGRGKHGGQMRDEFRTDFDPGRGGYGNIIAQQIAGEIWSTLGGAEIQKQTEDDDLNSNVEEGLVVLLTEQFTLRFYQARRARGGTMSSGNQVANDNCALPVACFDVLFNRQVALYFPEDDVTGSVKITLNQPLRLSNLRLHFRGRTKFENFPPSLARQAGNRTLELDYFDKEVVLVDRLPGKEDTGEVVLPSGDHLVPFTFPLPKRLISSYEGKYGSVRYYCQAVITRAGQSSYVTERPFTVLNRDSALSSNGANSSSYKELLRPAVHSDSEKVSNCCTSGLISCELSLPKLIYYPGENVVASLQVVNDSRSTLSKISAALVQNEICLYQSDPGVELFKTCRCVVENDLDKRLSGRNKKSWANEFILTIPSVPPSSDACPILHISYELHVKLAFKSRSSQALLVQAPIHIASPLELSSSPSASDSVDQGVFEMTDSKDGTAQTRPFKFVQCAFGPNIFEMADNPSPLNRVEFAPVYPVLLD